MTKNISPKELLYIEDALGHTDQMKKSFHDLASQLQDNDLKAFAEGLSAKQNEFFGSFYGLIGN